MKGLANTLQFLTGRVRACSVKGANKYVSRIA
eukprot:COSAG01_NODE_74720_length_202_cov_31.281553_1_plen_31_part_01